MPSLKSNNKNNKVRLTKKKDTHFIFHQHNIGGCEVLEKDMLDSYGQKIRYERLKKNLRTVKNYLQHNKIQADLLTLQEVQETKDTALTYLKRKYKVIYRKTGIIHYLTLDKKEEIIEDIDHGCAVVYDTDKFSLVKTIDDFMIPTKKNYLPRSTPWIILKRKSNGEKIAVISLHGLIFDPASDSRLVRNKYFYMNLSRSIKLVEREEKPDHFIIGTDLNTNIYNPMFNAFHNKEPNYLEELKRNGPIFKSYLKEFRELLEKKHIVSAIDRKIKTNYNWNEEKQIAFYDQIDFVLHSKSLTKLGWTLNTRQYMGCKVKNIEELEFLENDFDHLNIQVRFN